MNRAGRDGRDAIAIADDIFCVLLVCMVGASDVKNILIAAVFVVVFK